ncbi:SRPBCC family protein [Dietzia sp. UBA5065]|jgi:hypothetical protein|uniref:SRPBCC family protein n=1 Tax=Dietzia sp. UBA5065 TaxID=1946422 RepID=UPI0025C6A5EB|nr:SRPBCC family protein [Dietzia sp. UBA5065]HMT49226.1 SRPBCC family protein [Dietzia sp.]
MAAEFSITRSAVLRAPAPAVFAQIEDFRAWTAWSPWDRINPTMHREYSGRQRGVGARYAWSGAGRAGAGAMEIVDAAAGRQVVIHLRLVDPVRARSTMVFTLRPLGPDTTDVTWTMSGRRGLLTRLLALRVGMDSMIDRQLEESLEALGRAARSETGSARR